MRYRSVIPTLPYQNPHVFRCKLFPCCIANNTYDFFSKDNGCFPVFKTPIFTQQKKCVTKVTRLQAPFKSLYFKQIGGYFFVTSL